MIRSIRNKGLRRLVEKGDPSRLSVPNLARVERILAALQTARRPEEMDLPGYRLHPLKGAARGRYAVDASGNWRITFGWDGEDAIDVDLEDYH